MDPRQPQQHLFSRHTVSPYGRTQFSASSPGSNQPPYVAPSQQPHNTVPYADHQRRPSDPPYSNYPQRQYSGDGPQTTGPSHSRNQSASSIGHGTSMGRGMPPPSSPQQRDTQHPYGPPSRLHTESAGPPGGFTSGRELPALPSGRPNSTAGGSMSIHSILGGPPPASREQPSHYASPVSTAGPQGPAFTSASPRMTSAGDHVPFRRPLTPEHQRSYESRDQRADSAGSPPGVGQFTPDARRYGTPQTYGQRSMQLEERREPNRFPNTRSTVPRRPSSQPGAYGSRATESRVPARNDSGLGFGAREAADPRAPVHNDAGLSLTEGFGKFRPESNRSEARPETTDSSPKFSKSRTPLDSRAPAQNEPGFSLFGPKKKSTPPPTRPRSPPAAARLRPDPSAVEPDESRDITMFGRLGFMESERKRRTAGGSTAFGIPTLATRSKFSDEEKALMAAVVERPRAEQQQEHSRFGEDSSLSSFREREEMLQRWEASRRELANVPISETLERSRQQEFAHQLAQRNAQAYSRAPESKTPGWMTHAWDPPRPEYEPIPEQETHRREPLPSHGYPITTASEHSGDPRLPYGDPYAQARPTAARETYPPPFLSHQAAIERNAQMASGTYPESNSARMLREAAERTRRLQEVRTSYPQSQNPSYQSQESPTRRPHEEAQQQTQQQVPRNFLGVQEMNRKGRISPLPQAVQGAQGQIGTPGAEPGIKSEFGRMFSGIGSGVGAMGVPSPVNSDPQSLPNSGQFRRDDLDSMQGQDSPIENGGFKLARSPSRGGRRRKLKDEDGRDDDSSTGRRTPSGNGRGKRPKVHHHHHNYHHHHHHHRADPLDNPLSPSQYNLTPFKNVKGTPIPSPPDAQAVLHHHHVPRHHHHQVTPAKSVPQPRVITPLLKLTIRSKAVIQSVAHIPRKHLGHAYYESQLKAAGRIVNNAPSKRGFVSTPKPLPRQDGHENSTFTVKVSRAHLIDSSREEITARKFLWGTDIYTDDSDVIAACIHQGWFRGKWAPDIDESLLFDADPIDSPLQTLYTSPPKDGPIRVPTKRDLNITLLILPTLEKYASTTRFGIRSREWGAKRDGYKGQHDGLSFMILQLEWIDGVDGENKDRSERKRLIVRDAEEAEREDEKWKGLFNGVEIGLRNGGVNESFERGVGVGVGVGEGIKDVGTGSWWARPGGGGGGATKEMPEKEKEGQEENLDVDVRDVRAVGDVGDVRDVSDVRDEMEVAAI